MWLLRLHVMLKDICCTCPDISMLTLTWLIIYCYGLSAETSLSTSGHYVGYNSIFKGRKGEKKEEREKDREKDKWSSRRRKAEHRFRETGMGWKKCMWRVYCKLTREPVWLLLSNVQLSRKVQSHKYIVEPSWLCDVIFHQQLGWVQACRKQKTYWVVLFSLVVLPRVTEQLGY